MRTAEAIPAAAMIDDDVQQGQGGGAGGRGGGVRGGQVERDLRPPHTLN